MSKFIYFIQSWFVFVIALYISPCSSHKCIHDDHGFVSNAPVSLIEKRSVKYQDIAEERNKNLDSFEPLKIHVYIDILEKNINRNTIYNIQLAIEKIKTFIEKTFKVKERKRPFVLEREACSHKWQYGINRGKCSDYRGEIEECPAKGITYMIPARFISKLEIYDFYKPAPRVVKSSGPGLLDANFIAFIVGENTYPCKEMDIAAYGTFCRVDPKSQEPLAGIINLCPAYFTKKIYPPMHYYNIILHELFHILGFSSSLFERFLPCEKGIYCDIPKRVIQEDSHGIPRMVFPLVAKNAQEHFDCSDADFGAPMASPDNDTGVSFYSSHWHPILMYSSIMAPSFSEFDKLFVDNITLAVFASTGWYHVNFSMADNFTFGLKEGCDFGLRSCNDSNLCSPNLNKKGCNLEHTAIGSCVNLSESVENSTGYQCGVYRPFTMEVCESDVNQFGFDLHFLGYKQKCFMFENSETVQPHCCLVKCKSEHNYSILVNTTWYPCQSQQWITVNDTSIYCPETFSFCGGVSVNAENHFCPFETEYFIAVRMYFGQPDFKLLKEYQSFKNFKTKLMEGISHNINIPVNYLVNSSLSVFKKIFLDFAICPPPSVDPVELTVILMKTQSFLDSGSFMHILDGLEAIVISSSNIKIEPADVIAFNDNDGFEVLTAFPVICAIFLLVTFVASLIRQFIIQRHRPQRSPVQSESDIGLSDRPVSV